jgi:hypothetical protein
MFVLRAQQTLRQLVHRAVRLPEVGLAWQAKVRWMDRELVLVEQECWCWVWQEAMRERQQ